MRTPVAVLVLIFAFSLSADSFSAGPLRGKLLDPPHQIYYCFPGYSARSANLPGLELQGTLYYANEFRGYAININDETPGPDGRLDADRAAELTAMDYESAVAEADVSYSAGDGWRWGGVLRLYSYFGGFLDPLIEGFHGLFSLPNAAREYYPQGQTTVDIRNNNDLEISLGGPALLFGDISLYAIRTLSEGRDRALAVAFALELPTGMPGTPAGNGYVDTGVQLLFEQSLGSRWVVHLQQGLVIPGELVSGSRSEPFPVSQSLLALEWRRSPGLSLLLQARLHSPVLTSDEELNHELFSGADQFELPVTAVLFGLRRRQADWLWQAYIEEDALTHEGPDILFSFSMGRMIR